MNKIENYINKWKNRNYSEDIPDEVPQELMDLGLAPSYKAVAIAILKNDLHFTSLGYSAPKSEWYGFLKRVEIKSKEIDNK